jgi:hypothetical protein
MGTHGSMRVADQQRMVRLALAAIAEQKGTAHVPLAHELVAELHRRHLVVADSENAQAHLVAVLATASRLLTMVDHRVGDDLCLDCGRTDRHHARHCSVAMLQAFVDAQPAQTPATQPDEPGG